VKKQRQMSVRMVRMKRIMIMSIVVALCLIGAGATARADNLAYFAGNDGQFGVLDLDTGNYTQLGNFLINGSGSAVELNGLGVANGQLFGNPNVGGSSSPLYSVNPNNGSLTLIGGSFNAWGGFGSTTTGLYALTTGSTAYLYSIDPATGAATPSGGLATTTQRGVDWGLSTNSNTLYYGGNGYLYALNTSDGSTVASYRFQDSSGNTVYIGAMIEEGGILYGVDNNRTIWEINPSTGVVTYHASFSLSLNSNGTVELCDGLAPDPLPSSSVPLPAPLLLLGSGLVGLVGVRRRFKG